MYPNSFFSSHIDLKLKNEIPEMEIAYIICPHTIIRIYSKVYGKYGILLLILLIRSL